MSTQSPTGSDRFVWLIVSSLALLAVFQVFWLRKVWAEQREALRQETDNVFQRTVLALQDSLTRRALRRDGFSPDSVKMRMPPPTVLRTMHLKNKMERSVTRETSTVRGAKPDTTQYEQVKVFITSSAEDAAMPPAGVDRLLLNWKGPADHTETGDFIIRIEQDTLSTVELREHYATALRDAGLPLDFQLLELEDAELPDSGVLATRPARAGLLTNRAYSAVFPDYQGFVFKKALPYGLFSLLLFGVTATAFAAVWRSLRRQRRLTKLKNDFLANITHELKTPLTTVGVALEALRDFEARHDPARTREYLDISQLELERLGLLVDKVLHLSRFEQQEPRLRFEPLDLAEIVGQVLHALRLQAERAGAQLHFAPPDGATFPVSGDRLHLSGVVFNLLDNALKYVRNRPEIRVFLEKNAHTVRLTVRDNGPGIAPEFQAKIFGKFFRVPAEADTHGVKGHGLGLSYAAEVVRLHGGHIRVESVEHEGSSFIVELPVLEEKQAQGD